MRADRLLAELLILQRRGRVTASELALELEVSVRTIHRDVYALRVAGVPVVTDRGVGGGISIRGSWQTDLTGLSGDELGALSLIAAVNPAGQIHEAGRTALAKLGALLPGYPHSETSTVLIEPGGDSPEAGELHLVGTIERALRRNRRLTVTLRRAFDTIVTREADPLGLVFSGRAWHMVWTAGDDRIRVDQLAGIVTVEPASEAISRPRGFDLESFWASYRAAKADQTGGYKVRATVTENVLPLLRGHIEGLPSVNAEGRTEVVLGFGSLDQARSTLLGFGGAVQVLAPKALARSVADFAAQTLGRYS